ncbi:MAG: sigma 54-interacting transcriptional regulator [Gammaproteobacteria bacterium]
MTPAVTQTHAAQGRILVVDDDPGLQRLLVMRLTAAGHKVQTADSGEQALVQLPLFRPQVVITDLRMSGMDGMTLFNNIRRRDQTLPVIILTAHGTIPDAVDATYNGVFAYLTKPFDSQMLLKWVDDALRIAGKPYLPEEHDPTPSWRTGIITRSLLIEDLLHQAKLVSSGDVAVLIQGESGTGKELLARAIHQASPRADKPFVAVNCAAIPETLLESELFGYSKGAFTGATADRRGLFQAADGGTLFLDEIGDMPLSFQVKLLRVLQEKEVRPVGANHPVAVDARIISATNRDLEQRVTSREFREDLFYRLAVVPLTMPPLAARREDIPLLVTHFLSLLSKGNGKKIRGFSPQAMELLLSAPWPGNVRQLQNVVEQTAALATTPLIPEILVQNALRDKTGQVASLSEAREHFEREYLVQLLQITEGNVSQAAHLAKRNRTEFYKLLHRYQLDPVAFRTGSGES